MPVTQHCLSLNSVYIMPVTQQCTSLNSVYIMPVTQQWTSLNSVYIIIMPVTQQCLHVNCLQMTVKMQWSPNSPDLNPVSCLRRDARSILKASASAKTVSELKTALEKMQDNLPQPQVQSANLSRIFGNRMREFLNASGGICSICCNPKSVCVALNSTR